MTLKSSKFVSFIFILVYSIIEVCIESGYIILLSSSSIKGNDYLLYNYFSLSPLQSSKNKTLFVFITKKL